MVPIMTSADRVKRFRERRLASGMREVRCWLKEEDIDLLRMLANHCGLSAQVIITRALREMGKVTLNEIKPENHEQLPCRRRAKLSLSA